jgi:hypothetical protein
MQRLQAIYKDWCAMAFHEAVYVWDFNNNEFNTVIHYSDDAGGDVDYQGATDEVYDAWVAIAGAPFVNDLVWQGIRWRQDIPGGVGNMYIPTLGTIAGASGASNAVAQTAAIVRKLGVGSVRPVKGRIYQPGIPGAGIEDSGLIAGATANPIETWWEAVMSIADGSGATLTMVIKASNPTAPNTQAYTVVGGLQVVGNPGTQRRRRLGSGS